MRRGGRIERRENRRERKREERQNRFRKEEKEERKERIQRDMRGEDCLGSWNQSTDFSSTLCLLDLSKDQCSLAFGSQSKTIKTTKHRKELRSHMIKR